MCVSCLLPNYTVVDVIIIIIIIVIIIMWCYHRQNCICLIVLPLNHLNFVTLLSCQMPEAFWYVEFIMTSHYQPITHSLV